MIPTIEDILKGFRSGAYSMEQCLGWLAEHSRLDREELLPADGSIFSGDIIKAAAEYLQPEVPINPVAWRFKPTAAAKTWSYTDRKPGYMHGDEVIEPLYAVPTPQKDEA
jgi:hypothetical protein